MTDLFGLSAPRAPFVDIRNTRESTEQKKAELCLRLNKLCKTAPKSLASASINKVREWKSAQQFALKTLNSSRSSCTELEYAIKCMQVFDTEVMV